MRNLKLGQALLTASVMVVVLALGMLAGEGRAARDHEAVEKFLAAYGLEPGGEPRAFGVVVPASWEVEYGEYPEGLYWALASEFSRDAGLDLEVLKGERVRVWRAPLEGGLPGKGEQSQFTYLTDIVVLLKDGKIAGAWLQFNVMEVGPSVGGRSLEDVAGLPFEEWVWQSGVFVDSPANADLAEMDPAGVLEAFFAAVNAGDRTRAHVCLTPGELLRSLTANLGPDPACLYHSGWSIYNSLVENIVSGEMTGIRLYDPDAPAETITDLTGLARVGAEMRLHVRWREPAFNQREGPETRFAIMERTPFGWKLGGLGTGP